MPLPGAPHADDVGRGQPRTPDGGVEKDLGPARVGRGVFGADMRVSLVNDGPFTVLLDTDELGWGSSKG